MTIMREIERAQRPCFCDNDTEKNGKGFAGLRDLATNVEEDVEPKKSARVDAASTQEKECTTPKERSSKQTAAPKSKPPSPPPTAEQAATPPPKRSSAAKWLWSIVGIGILLALFNSGQEDRTSSGSRSTYSPSSSAPSTYTPSRTPSSLEFSKPQAGTNKVLSVAQIRWCLREDMRIETKRPYTNMDWEVDAFNEMVSDYNQRCGSFHYRRGTLERARREVEAMRSQIVAEALARSTTPSTPSIAVSPPSWSTSSQQSQPRVGSDTSRPSTSTQSPWTQQQPTTSFSTTDRSVSSPDSRRKKEELSLSSGTSKPRTISKRVASELSRNEIRKLQKYLTALGYQPGPIDGIAGPQTQTALMEFQSDSGRSADGRFTRDIFAALKQSAATVKPIHRTYPGTSTGREGRGVQESWGERPRQPTYSTRFRKGSTRSTVIAAAGEPSFTQTDYDDNVERLWYHTCFVEISLATGKVVGWHDSPDYGGCSLPAVR